MRRLVGLAVALVAVPVTAWVILGSGGHARAAVAGVQVRAPAVRHAPDVLVPNQSGSSCYVAAGACSETPCVEFVQSQSAVPVAPMAGAVVPSPKSRCPAHSSRPSRPPTSGGGSRTPGTVPTDQSVVSAALARASRALAHRATVGGG